MYIVYNKILPFSKKFYAINILGVLFAKGPCDAVLLNHERIHTAQIREWAYLPFYLLYVIEWAWRYARCRNWMSAYRSITFEREAYANQSNLDYLKTRRHYNNFRQPVQCSQQIVGEDCIFAKE